MNMERQIPIDLKRSERELLLNVLDVDPAVEKKLVKPQSKGNLLSIVLSAEELSGLLVALAREMEAAEDANMRRAYEELQEKLEAIDSAGKEGPSEA